MKKKVSLLAAAAVCSTSLYSMQFQTLGYKSVAMGGAAVASSSGSFATYNNPALLANTTYDVEFALGGGVAFEDHGAGASVSALDENGFMDVLDKAGEDVDSLTDEDKNILITGKDIVLGMDGDALSVDPQLFLSMQVGNFGFGVFGSSNAVATAKVDQTHDQLYFQNDDKYYDIDGNEVTQSEYENYSMEYAIDNGDTYLDVRGIAIAEVPIAYGVSFDSAGKLMIGGAVKYMKGISYIDRLQLDDSDEEQDYKKDVTTDTFGIDVGIAYQPAIAKDLTLAVVGKNLNSPTFDTVGEDGEVAGEITVKPLVRAGVAYNLFESLEVAVDYDITSNETLVDGFKSRMVGGGISWHPASWLAFRGGAMQNLDASDNAGVIYTAGIGAGLKWFQFDISGQYSSNEATIDGQTVPEYAKINFAILSRW